MKVVIEKAADAADEMALIKTCELTQEIRDAVNLLENNIRSLAVVKAGETHLIAPGKIYYFESVDKRTYVYTKENCYETSLRLYELENLFGDDFIRCSKSLIVNIRKIRSVRSELNARMIGELLNGEKIIISRSCVKELKERLGI